MTSPTYIVQVASLNCFIGYDYVLDKLKLTTEITEIIECTLNIQELSAAIYKDLGIAKEYLIFWSKT